MLGLRNLDERVMQRMGELERDARLGQVEAVRQSFADAGTRTAQAGGLASRADLPNPGGDATIEQVMNTMQAGGGEADYLMAQAVANTPQGLLGRGAHLLAQDTTAGGIARGTVFGGGVTAGGAAMTAGAQKLMDLMGLFEEAEETEVARDQPLHS